MEENNLEQSQEQKPWKVFGQESEPQTKVEQVAQENNIEASISAPEPASSGEYSAPEVTSIASDDLAKSSQEPQALGSVANGAIGVSSSSSEKPSKQPYTKVCVYSQKNIHVPGLGKLLRGYQMVEKSTADQWLEKPYARLATPEEVAREFRK
jgi:hypothetical protein